MQPVWMGVRDATTDSARTRLVQHPYELMGEWVNGLSVLSWPRSDVGRGRTDQPAHGALFVHVRTPPDDA